MKNDVEKFQKLIDDFYEYTVTISITENELLDYYDEFKGTKELSYEGKIKIVKDDIKYDFENNLEKIEHQLAVDVCEYYNSSELSYIKAIYRAIKEIFPFFYVGDIDKLIYWG